MYLVEPCLIQCGYLVTRFLQRQSSNSLYSSSRISTLHVCIHPVRVCVHLDINMDDPYFFCNPNGRYTVLYLGFLFSIYCFWELVLHYYTQHFLIHLSGLIVFCSMNAPKLYNQSPREGYLGWLQSSDLINNAAIDSPLENCFWKALGFQCWCLTT